MTNAWKSGRPIYHRLPIDAERYQNNPVVEAFTRPLDKIFIDYKAALQNFETDFLNPDTARTENLDWLAQLCGFTGKFWSTKWSDTVKRKLIKNSHTFIWKNIGTERLLRWLLGEVFELSFRIYQLSAFIVGTSKVGDTAGSDYLKYYIIVPIQYVRTSENWRLIELMNKLYMPIFSVSRVVYDRFYVGYSVVGDPILS